MEEQENIIELDNNTFLHIKFISKDIALKSILFGLLFYIVNSKLSNKILSNLDKYTWIERNLIQSILFTILFYLINIILSI